MPPPVPTLPPPTRDPPPQVSPLFAVIGLASIVCGSYLNKFFGGNSDVRWSKELRKNADVGQNERRVNWHNNRFGMRTTNKERVTIFPFYFKPMNEIIENHRFDKS